jgi:glycine C-acetyltransferase
MAKPCLRPKYCRNIYFTIVLREFSKKLFENGLFAMALGFPTVPRDKARIRVMISASHSQQDLEEALYIFDKVGKEVLRN